MSYQQPDLDSTELTRKLPKSQTFDSGFQVYGIAPIDNGRWAVVMNTVDAKGKIKGEWVICGQTEEVKEFAGDTFMKELRYRERVQY